MPVTQINTSQAVERLFGTGGKCLRNKANSYVRNQTIPPASVDNQGFSDASLNIRGKQLLDTSSLSCLFNALLLDAFFNDTKVVKKIIESPDERASRVPIVEEVLLSAQKVTQISALSASAQAFIGELTSTKFDVYRTRFSSPFNGSKLPQIDLGLHNTGLLYTLLRQNRVGISLKEQLMVEVLEANLEEAHQLLKQIEPELIQQDASLAVITSFVSRQYQEATAFNRLLNQLPE